MNYLIISVLALVQGVAEFLPISSSGHLIICYKLFGIENGTMFLSILLHFATLLSVVMFYRKELFYYIKNFKSKTTIKFIITTLCTIIIFLLFKKFVLNSYSGNNLIWCFLITATMLFFSEQYYYKKNKNEFVTKKQKLESKTKLIKTKINSFTFNTINYFKSAIIGIVQGFATLPGISRSGSTISSALFLGINKREGFDYSFIISIPIIIGSIFFEMIDFIKNPEILTFSIFQLFVGFVVCFLVGLLSLKILQKIIKNQKLYYFSFYLVILCLILIIFKVL